MIADNLPATSVVGGWTPHGPGRGQQCALRTPPENEIDDAVDFLWLSTTQDTAKFFEDLNCLLSPYSRSSSQVHTRLWTSKTIQIRTAFFRLMNLSRWTEWPKAASTKSSKARAREGKFLDYKQALLVLEDIVLDRSVLFVATNK